MLETVFNDNYHRKVGSPFGVDSAGRTNSHRGVDYGANIGEPVFPAAKDTPVEITKAEAGVNQNYWGNKPNNLKDWGNYVIYYMPEYDTSVSYAHLDKVNVKTGDKVGYKQLGTSGNTGYSSGPHLDLMIAKGKITTLSEMRNKAVDPEKFVLKKIEKTPAGDFKKGSKVVLNGTVHENSSGANPGMAFKDKEGTITIVNEGAKYPYHIDNLGWVTPDAIGAAKPEPKPTPAPKPAPKPKPVPEPKPQPTKNAHGQNVKVGDKIQFSVLYTQDSGGVMYRPNRLVYTEKRGNTLVGYGYVERITSRGYRVTGTKGGSVVGYVRAINTY